MSTTTPLDGDAAVGDACRAEPSLLDPVLADLDQLLERYPHPIFQAAVAGARRRTLRRSRNYDAWRTRLRDGQITLWNLDDIRQTAVEMFRMLVEHSQRAHAGEADGAAVYRSVSVASSRGYFGRPCIGVLTNAFDSAVARYLGAAHGALEHLALDRLVIVPTRYWIDKHDEVTSAQRTFWLPIRRALGALQARYEHHKLVKLTIRLMPAQTAKDRHLPLEGLDFGLYGDIAVGLYTRHGERERLTLWPGDATEMRRCDAAWRVLTDPFAKAISWAEMAVRLDLDTCLERDG